MKRPILASAIALLAGAAALSVTAFADPNQRGYGPMGAYGMMGMMNMMEMMNGQGGMHGYAQINPDQLAKIKGEVKITAEQEPSWQAYAAALLKLDENFEALHEGMHPQEMHEMSFEDRQAFMQSVWEARSEDLKAVKDAKAKLFEVLTPEQQKVAGPLLTFTSQPWGYGGAGMMRGPGMGPTR